MKIGKYELDKQQMDVVLDESDSTLVVAGAGSGKTLTLLGKINYLVNTKGIKESEILCISFTREASNSLKNKIKNELNINIDVYTFHKLSLNIINNKYSIAMDNLLEEIINEYFNITINNKNNIIFKYLKIKNMCEYLKLNKEIYSLKSLIAKFIRLFKSSNHKLEDFIEFKSKIKTITNVFNYKKEKLFLIMCINIYLMYDNYLKDNDEIDFDDMLIYAKEYVDKHGYINNLKYVIIDEFQDTSFLRFSLIKSIINKTNAKLLVVGDDFQSIYKFTGCDLNLFINFKNYFNNSKILKIENTYRNSNELINIAGSFIMRNKIQIKKNLVSSKHIEKPIVIVYTNNVNKLIDYIGNNIMLLGRNNNDINKYIDDINIYKDRNIYYLTVHKSKGLEEENVIILNVIDNKLGFPNKIKDDRILRLVSPVDNKFPYSEERRLFYVALTRTKNKVYLMTNKNNESIFIKELKIFYKNKIEELLL